MTSRAAIFVLGMHRSGTSALSRVLSLLGASLPRHVLPPGPGNESGHWEPERAVALNDRILAEAGTRVEGINGPPDAWFASEAAEAFVAPMQALIHEEFATAPLFVFKDPRSALVFPLWRRALKELGIGCLPVIISRNPVEVAQSLADRQTRAEPWQSWPTDRGGLLWLRYAVAAERHSRGCTRAFCTFDELLADWQGTLGRIACDLGIAWPRSPLEAAPDISRFLDPKHRHQHVVEPAQGRGGAWSSWITPAFEALRRGPDMALLDAIGRSFDDACEAVLDGAVHRATEQRKVDPEIAGILAVSAAHAAILSEVGREASRRAAVLAERLAERTEAARCAERYARSLEQTMHEMRATHETTVAYTRSLEQARDRAEAYARQLEAHLANAPEPTAPASHTTPEA
ncbi:sulfotransferase family protein [Roseomonas sp. HF4]|uniref:sulfotransferase family protein n=1 Tax=Roseomonas sp. HF4 TaxID=2562313 RepID=UPI0010C13A18|nr:sulfotransferase [Roseomonas sp. HF4]